MLTRFSKRAAPPSHYSFQRRIRTAPFGTINAVPVATTRSGPFDPRSRTSPVAAMTARLLVRTALAVPRQ